MKILHEYPQRNLAVTGYSYGGAIATLAVLDIIEAGIAHASRVHLYTFGAPRVGDEAFVSAIATAGFASLYRYV